MDPQNTGNFNNKNVMDSNAQRALNAHQLASFDQAFPYHCTYTSPYNPIDSFEDQNINPQQSKPVRVNVSDTSRSILMEQNSFRDTQSQENENVLQAYDITSNQQEINDDMKFLSHSDLIDLNLNELNNLLTGSDQHFGPTEKEYFLEAFNLESNINQPNSIYYNNQLVNHFNNHRYQPDPEAFLTQTQKEAQGKTIQLDPTKNQTYFLPRIDQQQDDSLLSNSSIVDDSLLNGSSMLDDSYNVLPIMSSTMKSPEKNYLLIPVNEDIENSSMLQNCKSIYLNTEVMNQINSASAGRSGVLLPLQMDTCNDSVSPNIKRKSPIRVVRSFTTNRIVTSKNKPETSTSSGANETTNITVHQTINIYEDAVEYSIKNPPSRIRKRKQTFESVKQSDVSVTHSNMDAPVLKRPVQEEQLTPAPLFSIQQLPTTSLSSQQQPLFDSGIGSMINDKSMDKSKSSKVTTKKTVHLKRKKTEKCPKCNQSFKKLSVHIGRCSFDPSLLVVKEKPKQTIESFTCDICLKSFRNEKILIAHELGHKQIRCKFCNKVQLSEKELNKHLETCAIESKKSDFK